MVSFLLYYILCASDAGIGSKPVGGMLMFPEDWFAAAAAVPNIFFSITFQANTFPLFKGMKNPNDSKMARVAFLGVSFCSASSILIGFLDYNSIGSAVQVKFLASF